MLIVRSLLVVMAVIGAGPAAGQTSAQNYPTKPIRIITGAIGGGIDFNARAAGQALTDAFGQQAVIDNRGGGGGIMAGELFAKSPPDGYTLLAYSSNIWLLPLLRDGVAFDPVRDFAPVTTTGMAPNTLVVTPSLPVASVKELITYARERPGKLSYAHAGVGGPQHLAAELFISMAGVNIVPIAYKANGPAYNDVMTGQVQAIFAVSYTVASLVAAGRLRALAVSSARRTPLAPGLPTIAESGLPGYENLAVNAVFAPAKTPPALIRRLNETLVQWARSAETQKRYFNSGAEITGSTPEALASVVKADMAKWGKIIKERGIRGE